jgi:tRNA A-37 threonylcarbamoyl transferase component Bud32
MAGFESLLAGRMLGERYRVENLIGRGGMGAVFLATDTRLEREVALKVVTVATSDAAARQRLRARFHREARCAARLQHPHVVTVFDYGTDTGLDLDYLVMELLRGEDLARRLARQGRLPLDEALAVAHDAARGLAAGHRAGMVHRDVKPGNIFLEDRGADGLRVVVLDFGIVKHADDADDAATVTQLTVLGAAPHSPAYAAPEQLQGDPELSPACDVFGLGVTLFQMLGGMRPFSETDQQRMAAGQSVKVPALRSVNPQIPSDVEAVVRTALAIRPADRFADGAGIAEALAALRGVASGSTTLVPRQDAARQRPTPPPADDATWLDDGVAGTQFLEATSRTRVQPAGSGLAATRAQPDAADAIANAPPALRQTSPAVATSAGWLRRAAVATWEVTVTLFALTLALGFGIGMNEAFDQGLDEPFYACAIGLTLALPWAVHRIGRRRGSYLAGMLAAGAVAVAGFYYFAPLVGHHTLVLVLPFAQLVAAAWVIRLTRRTSG